MISKIVVYDKNNKINNLIRIIILKFNIKIYNYIVILRIKIIIFYLYNTNIINYESR